MSRPRVPARGGRAEEGVLDQPLRRQIFEYIRAHPGESYTQIKGNLVLSKGGLTHHLQVLEREGLVRSRSEKGRKALYSAEALATAVGEGRSRIEERLLGTLHQMPGARISEVAGLLGISRQLATHYARLLAQQGLLRLERRADRLCGVPVGAREVPRQHPWTDTLPEEDDDCP